MGPFFRFLALGLFTCSIASAQTAEDYRQRAVEFSRAKAWDQAIVNYRKALDLEPNDATTHYDLALALKYKGDAPQAVEEFESTLKLKPKWADAHYALASTLYDRHEADAAKKELRLALELDPANAAAHRLMARIYSQQNDYSAAERELRRALQIKPAQELHFELGLIEGQVGNLARSEEHTSELQSPCNLVCRLLLEKKKTNYVRVSTTIA